MIHFGSVNGTLTALALFAVIFATLGWGVGRAVVRRTQPVRRRLAWTVGILLFAGPLLAVYATSFAGFYGAQLQDATLHLRYLVPGVTRDIPRTNVQSVEARPWHRGRWRLAIVTTGGERYESTTDSQVFIHLARAFLERQLSGSEATPALTPVPTPVAASVDVTYLANEGLLISSGDHRVVIDGLHRPYETYAHLPAREREAIENAQPPFDGIDLVLVSHIHLDHFHPEAIGRHLSANPGARLTSSPQVVSEILKSFSAGAIEPRLTALEVPVGQRRPAPVEGINVELLGLSHGSRWHEIQNLGHLIRIGGKTLLHVGDADATAANFEPLRLAQENIDVAFLPSWFLTESTGRLIVHELIRPRQIVAVHMPSSNTESIVRAIRESFPAAEVFTKPLERRKY